LDLMKMKTENTEPTPENRAACGHMKRGVIRLTFAFVHLWLAMTHFWDIEEGQQFFADERDGRRRRLKRAAINKIFPHLDGV